MIVWGWRKRAEPEWAGILACPNCSRWRLHHGLKIKRTFTLFFMPLVPLWSDSTTSCAVCLRQEKLNAAQYALAAREGKRLLDIADLAQSDPIAYQRAMLEMKDAGLPILGDTFEATTVVPNVSSVPELADGAPS
jgi:hypothetical protein